jgi:hypothetical protein
MLDDPVRVPRRTAPGHERRSCSDEQARDAGSSIEARAIPATCECFRRERREGEGQVLLVAQAAAAHGPGTIAAEIRVRRTSRARCWRASFGRGVMYQSRQAGDRDRMRSVKRSFTQMCRDSRTTRPSTPTVPTCGDSRSPDSQARTRGFCAVSPTSSKRSSVATGRSASSATCTARCIWRSATDSGVIDGARCASWRGDRG